MSVFCIECGTDLPNDANFCWKCGKPQNSNVSSSEPQWELCDIQYKYITDTLISRAWGILGVDVVDAVILEAKATGPKGVYIAKRSKKFKYSHNHELDKFKDIFINDLVRDGWKPVPGSNPQQFRRRIK